MRKCRTCVYLVLPQVKKRKYNYLKAPARCLVWGDPVYDPKEEGCVYHNHKAGD